MASSSATDPDTLVTLKVNIEGSNRRFKLPLRDLGANTLPDKVCHSSRRGRGSGVLPDFRTVVLPSLSFPLYVLFFLLSLVLMAKLTVDSTLVTQSFGHHSIL